MNRLSPHDVVRAWEWGWNRHPIDRALFMLQLAAPELTWAELTALSVGRRNAWLLKVREQLFGPMLSCYINCPRCAVALEFGLNMADIPAAKPDQVAAGYQLAIDGWALRFRLPDSRDLAAVVGSARLTDARVLLLRRCVTQVSRDEAPQAPDALPEHVVVVLAERMQELDPQAEMRLRLTCDHCQYDWPANLDIVAFLWTELAALAQRLLREVHAIARAYGWPENDILSLSDTRRQFYLEMIGA